MSKESPVKGFATVLSNEYLNFLHIQSLIDFSVKFPNVSRFMEHCCKLREKCSSNEKQRYSYFPIKTFHFENIKKLPQKSMTLHKKWSFPLSISSVNETKSAGNCGFGHIYWRNCWWKTSFFVQCTLQNSSK